MSNQRIDPPRPNPKKNPLPFANRTNKSTNAIRSAGREKSRIKVVAEVLPLVRSEADLVTPPSSQSWYPGRVGQDLGRAARLAFCFPSKGGPGSGRGANRDRVFVRQHGVPNPVPKSIVTE